MKKCLKFIKLDNKYYLAEIKSIEKNKELNDPDVLKTDKCSNKFSK